MSQHTDTTAIDAGDMRRTLVVLSTAILRDKIDDDVRKAAKIALRRWSESEDGPAPEASGGNEGVVCDEG